MGFFDFLKRPDINQGLKEYHTTPGAVLLDVRTPQEYQEGHIPQSQNLPLHTIDRIASVSDDPALPLFVYCHSGARSAQAVHLLNQLGYSNVKNLGGIIAYSGKVER